MSTTMKEALDNLKQKRFDGIAETIVKYQNYKNSIAISKMDNSLGKSTRTNYLIYGIRYLKTGYKSDIVPKSLYIGLDKCLKNCTMPLRPSNSERKQTRKEYDYTKKENKPPVARLKMVNKSLTEKFTYGVKVNDNIVLQKSEIEAKAFLKGIKFLNNNNDNNEIKLVAVTISEVE